MESALETLKAMRDGSRELPPIYDLLQISVIDATEGEVKLQLTPHDGLRSPIGLVAGGVIATILDTTLAWACSTCVPSDKVCTTVELKVNFLRPISVTDGPLVATGRTVHRGNRILVATAELSQSSADGTRLIQCAIATGTCMAVQAPS
ncbi:hypothetical protein BLM14_25610 (plasmid) [Phyllobacterium zundukense]|nr:hypothetical protein BLM14_25610 [Phyllobacterium zundukense]